MTATGIPIGKLPVSSTLMELIKLFNQVIQRIEKETRVKLINLLINLSLERIAFLIQFVLTICKKLVRDALCHQLASNYFEVVRPS